VRVALAEDAVIFRHGLALLLQQMGMEVTHTADDEQSLLLGIADDPPDVVILDIRMPPTRTTEGFHAAESVRLRHPGTGILLLSSYDEIAYAAQLLERVPTGVGYLNKERVDDVPFLDDALHRIAAGEVVIDPLLLQHSPQAALRKLTDQERKAMRHLTAGRSNKGIAKAMFITEGAVEKLLASAFRKLGLNSDPHDNLRVQAVLRWYDTQQQ
jgi:DNA-binding NarL/FixJ family response regulator